MRGAAGLTIGTEGDLTSLIDINQFGGVVNVNGGITSVGDYTLFAGMLAGTGTVNAPFLTSITGVFSPGTMGTTGTLNINGNLVMSSGTTFLVDVGAAGVSDRLAVTGLANVGGIVSIGSAVTQQVIRITVRDPRSHRRRDSCCLPPGSEGVPPRYCWRGRYRDDAQAQ